MPSTYSLAPSFKWYFYDAEGRPAAGGKFYTYQNSTLLLPKATYWDPSGLNPHSNPITLDVTGGTPVPIYWEDDGVNKYFVVVKDADGNVIAEIDDFPISGAGGGSTPVTTYADVENYVINGQFHLIDPAFLVNDRPTILPSGDIYLAPGGGLFSDDFNSYSYEKTGKVLGWYFTKTGGNDVPDTISFTNPAAGGGPPGQPSENTKNIFTYSATPGTDPITELALKYAIPDARTFSSETLTISFDASSSLISGLTSIEIIQDFGTGGAGITSPVSTSANFTFPVNDYSARQQLQIVVPSVAGKTFGSDNNSRLILAINIPPNEYGKIFNITNVQIEKSATATGSFIYKTAAQTEALSMPNIVRNVSGNTGDFKLSLNPNAAHGWIVINDDNQTIGNHNSGAIFAGSIYYDLYVMIWDSYSQADAPVTPDPPGRGASADADFRNGKPLRFPPWVGRVFAGAGVGIGLPNKAAYTYEGDREVTLTIDQIPSHNHELGSSIIKPEDPLSSPSINVAQIENYPGTTPKASSFAGGGLAHENMQPTHYLHLHVKL